MFVHPRCPCSRASVADLGRVLQRVPGLAHTTVVFISPPGAAKGFEQTDLRDAVQRLTGVTLEDDDGTEARRFGAATSGATLLYDAGGRLVFAGGLTDVRGHEGRSFGEERIVAILQSGKADRPTTPVFGCSLFD